MSCSDLLWDSRQIRGKHIPTIQDVLLCCDDQTLLQVVEHLYASRMSGWADSSPQQRRVARKRMKRALESMRECPVKRKDGKGFGLFPEEHFAAHVRTHAMLIERCVRMRLVDFRDMSLFDPPEDVTASGGISDAEQYPGIFGFLPWSIALSYRVWLEGPWSCHERYMALADVFWQLTHQGFSDSGQSRAGGRRLLSCGATGNPPHASGRSVRGASSTGRPGRDRRLQACLAVDGDLGDVAARHGSQPAASVPELRGRSAAGMGLLVSDALEEAYLDKLLLRIEQLNEQAEGSLLARLEDFASRRVA